MAGDNIKQVFMTFFISVQEKKKGVKKTPFKYAYGFLIHN